jgi:thiosulfate dehydrogenase
LFHNAQNAGDPMRRSCFVIARLFLLAVVSGAPSAVVRAQPAAEPHPNAVAAWQVPDPAALPDDALGRQVRLGRDLVGHTSVLLGPDAPPNSRFTGNGLDCQSCHLKSGTQRFALSLVGVWQAYPAFSARAGKVQSLAARVNDCMERSMNGRSLPEQGVEMAAILAYLKFIGAEPAAAGRAVPKLPLPQHAADPVHGAAVYRNTCSACHGPDGAGVRYSPVEQRRRQRRYFFPPLWGADSYNDGAGMARTITAAWFVHANMPQGVTFADPLLSPEDAYDVAAYINQQPRPHKALLEKDYPNRWLKPADAAFPPLLGPFSRQQHALGPWPPIVDWLKTHAPPSAQAPPMVD